MRDLLAQTSDRLLEDLCVPGLVRQAEAGQWPQALWQAIEDAGLPLALAAEEVGGVGVGWRDALPIMLGCGRHAVPVPLVETLGAQALARCADLALPDGLLTLADLQPSPEGGYVALNVPFAHRAQYLVSSVEAGQADRHQLVVLEVSKARSVASATLAGECRQDLYWASAETFMSAPLPDGQSARLVGAALRCGQLAGAIQKVLELSLTYAEERKQFGKSLSKFQALQQQLAVLGQLAVSTAMAAELACGSADARLDRQRVAYAKALIGEVANQAAMIAHALHGAIGTTAEYDLQLYTRRMWAWRLDFGSDAYWSQVAGQALIASHQPLWSDVVSITAEVAPTRIEEC